MWQKKIVLTVHTPHSPHGLTSETARPRFARVVCPPVGANDSAGSARNSCRTTPSQVSSRHTMRGTDVVKASPWAQIRKAILGTELAVGAGSISSCDNARDGYDPAPSAAERLRSAGFLQVAGVGPIREPVVDARRCSFGERRSQAEEFHAPFASPLSRSHWQATNHRVSDAWNSTRWKPLLGDAPPEDIWAVRLRMEFRLLWCRDAL